MRARTHTRTHACVRAYECNARARHGKSCARDVSLLVVRCSFPSAGGGGLGKLCFGAGHPPPPSRLLCRQRRILVRLLAGAIRFVNDSTSGISADLVTSMHRRFYRTKICWEHIAAKHTHAHTQARSKISPHQRQHNKFV